MTPSPYRSLSLGSSKLLLYSIAMMGLLTVCGPSTADPTDPTKIVIKDFNFAPTPLTVKVGSTVTWTNTDDEPHTAVSDTGLFKSGGMDTNESFSFKFDKPGTYHYTCSIHPRMVGTIIVQ
jgi:plastocyanin